MNVWTWFYDQWLNLMIWMCIHFFFEGKLCGYFSLRAFSSVEVITLFSFIIELNILLFSNLQLEDHLTSYLRLRTFSKSLHICCNRVRKWCLILYQYMLQVVSDIKSRNPDASLKAFQVDLSSFVSILDFKHSLQQWLQDSNMHSSVQVLINNAGILATSRRFTSEGYDQLLFLRFFSMTIISVISLILFIYFSGEWE